MQLNSLARPEVCRIKRLRSCGARRPVGGEKICTLDTVWPMSMAVNSQSECARLDAEMRIQCDNRKIVS